MVCLFEEEVIIAAITIVLKKRGVLFYVGLVFLVSGIIISNRIEQFTSLSGVSKNVWFIHTVIV